MGMFEARLEEAIAMNRPRLDLYADYLLCSFGPATATGLSRMAEGAVSHDQITRFLDSEEFSSAKLWQVVKPLVRQVENETGVLIIDDALIEKPYTDQSELICWHFDHTKRHTIKGIDLLTSLYVVDEISLPVGFDLVTKTREYVDKKTGEIKVKSDMTKNERYRELVKAAVANHLLFGYVLNDVWFAGAENMRLIKLDLGKDFVMPLKSNRKVALSQQDKEQGRYQSICSLELQEGERWIVFLEQVPFPIVLIKKVFTNEEGSQGFLYLASSDTELSFDQIFGLYQRRWKVEEYHKSLKQNAALPKSPAHTTRTQSNHIFCALYAFVRLEQIKIKSACNHFALKAKIYLAAIRAAFDQLGALTRQYGVQFA